jgi:hypothetical protein
MLLAGLSTGLLDRPGEALFSAEARAARDSGRPRSPFVAAPAAAAGVAAAAGAGAGAVGGLAATAGLEVEEATAGAGWVGAGEAGLGLAATAGGLGGAAAAGVASAPAITVLLYWPSVAVSAPREVPGTRHPPSPTDVGAYAAVMLHIVSGASDAHLHLRALRTRLTSRLNGTKSGRWAHPTHVLHVLPYSSHPCSAPSLSPTFVPDDDAFLTCRSRR